MAEAPQTSSLAASEALRARMAVRVAEEMRDERLETYSEALLRVISKLVALATFNQVRLGTQGVCVLMLVIITICTSLLTIVSWPVDSSAPIGAILALHAWAATVAVLQLRSSWFFAGLLTETLSNSLITAFRNPRDMRDALTWLRRTFGKRRQFIFCLVISVLLTPLSMTGLALAGHDDWINAGSIVLSLCCWFLGATGWYFLIPGVSLSSRLRRYELNLFDADPANSQAIKAICSMMHAALFVSAAIATLFTTGIFLIAPQDVRLQISFSFLCAWGPLVFTMVHYQYSLSVVIRRAKARALGPLERSLVTAQRITDLDTAQIEHLGKLMDLHKRILATNNTALDWRESFTAVNTLLLPLISFAVAQLAKLG